MQRYEKLIVVFLCLLVFLFSSTREKTIWRYKALLTLKLFSENINFKKGSKTIMVGSDSQEFLEALESKQTVIKGVKIKSLLLSSNNSSEHPDVAFIDDIKLAEEIAQKGILVFSGNEKCTHAAFIITVNKRNKLRIVYNKKNIKNQGAEFPDEVFKTIDKYHGEK
jgi:hypothetical protein